MPDSVVTRFAPSPTGHLHIGGARTALFCWAFARRHEGRFLLRIEDTDQARSSESASRGILEDLAWLGIDWDEGPEYQADGRLIGGDPRSVGPFFQSQRADVYADHFNRLIERDLAYHAFETTEELEAKRKAAVARKQQYRYDRAALSIPRAERLRRAAAGEPHVLRFLMPDRPIVIHDEVLGNVTFGEEQLEDFVIRKADGFPTYHFAVVVDDDCMGVTHVLRGQEHLINTPRHVALQRAFGFRTPTYAHLPLIFNPDGSKMSKRDKDRVVREAAIKINLSSSPVASLAWDRVDEWLRDKRAQLELDALVELARAIHVHLPEINVEDFRASGYLPEVVCNYVALIGWNPGENVERFGRDFLARHFDLSRIGKSNARFDREKLLAFNADAIGAMTDDAFIDALREWAARYEPDLMARLDERTLPIVARAARPRARTLSDVRSVLAFALAEDHAIDFDPNAVEKVLRKNGGEGLRVLREIRPELERVEPFEPDAIEAVVKAFCDARSLGMGKAAQPLRVAVTGSAASPALGDTLALVGRNSVLHRIDRCLKQFEA